MFGRAGCGGLWFDVGDGEREDRRRARLKMYCESGVELGAVCELWLGEKLLFEGSRLFWREDVIAMCIMKWHIYTQSCVERLRIT